MSGGPARWAMAAVLALAACGPPDEARFEVRAADSLNPGPTGKPQPASVRLYLLSSPTRIVGADYFQLKDNDKAVLEDDLLGRRDINVWPGETVRVKLRVPQDATIVAVVASYRDIEKSTWLAVRKLPGDGEVPVLVDAKAVTLPKEFPPPPDKG